MTPHADGNAEFRAALLSLKERMKEPAARKILARRGVGPDQIEAALRRVEEGSYGICQQCFIVMPRGELLRQPYLEMCQICRSRQLRQLQAA